MGHKECQKRYYQKNKEKINEYRKAWYHKHIEEQREYHNKRSKKILAEKRANTKRICPVCGKEFSPEKSLKQKYCSDKCRYRAGYKRWYDKHKRSNKNGN